MKHYEVPVVYRGLCNYVVEADDAEQAEEKARCAFKNGEAATPFGNEWEELERFGTIVEVPQSESAEALATRLQAANCHRNMHDTWLRDRHVNAAYEYMTREAPTSPATIHSSFDADLIAKGWHRAWSDVTSEGTFIVYRRDRTPPELR